MSREIKTQNILAERKFVQGSTVKNAYWKHGVLYGRYFDLRIYKDVKITHYGDKNRDYSKNDEGTKRSDSLGRARVEMYRLIHANNHAHGRYRPIFVTYTFASDVTDIDTATKHFGLYIKRLNYVKKFKAKYVAVREIQYDREKRYGVRVWHFHVVFFNLPFIDASYHEKTIWGNGSCHIEAVQGLRDVGAYISKYLSADFQEKQLYGKKSFLASKGLVRPVDVFHSERIDDLVNRARVRVVSRYDCENYLQLKYKL